GRILLVESRGECATCEEHWLEWSQSSDRLPGGSPPTPSPGAENHFRPDIRPEPSFQSHQPPGRRLQKPCSAASLSSCAGGSRAPADRRISAPERHTRSFECGTQRSRRQTASGDKGK